MSRSDREQRYRLSIAPSARRQLSEVLPEAVAHAAYEFIVGALLNAHRVGKPLRPPLADRHSARRGTYRVIYRIDDTNRVVTVLGVSDTTKVLRTCWLTPQASSACL